MNEYGENYNESNKLLIRGYELELYNIGIHQKTGKYIYKIIQTINNRIIILLEEGQNINGLLQVPKGTHVTYITPRGTSSTELSIIYTSDKIVSRTLHTRGSTYIEGANKSHNKHTKNDATNFSISEQAINRYTGNNARNSEIYGKAINRHTGNDAVNKIVQGDGINHNTKGNTGSYYIQGNIINNNTWGLNQTNPL